MTGNPPDRASTPRRHILGLRVDYVEFEAASRLISGWAAESPPRGRYVCAANVHMTMEAYDDPGFRNIVNGADLVVADGVPLVWALRALGLPQQRRVRVTPDLLIDLFAACEASDIRIGLYGGTPESLAAFNAFLADAAPDLEVAFSWSPPFRPLTSPEDAAIADRIRAARVQLLLVGIGCPKQEQWMAAHAKRLDCVMLGVGAAFDMFAGKTRNAPRWMRDLGLEWVFRLVTEPRRLGRRYLVGNPRFLWHFAHQLSGRHWSW